MIVAVAEKPSVAAEIAKVLGATKKKDGYWEGSGYQVTWTFGHLCCLKNPEEYRPDWKKWDKNALPILPERFQIKLIDNAGVMKQFKVIKELFKKATCIVNCGDAGQEGELIQRWVMELANVKCPVKRLWISSLTEEAIREGFKALKPQSQYDTLYMAGLARAEGDWLLGMNATRLYTLLFGRNKQVLSIGRVQTPTLAMIVERDLQIEDFKPEPYWMLTTQYRGATFMAAVGKMDSEAEGRKLLDSIVGKEFHITDVTEKKGMEAPPQLYDLTSLQVDCNKKFGMSAEQTLKTIQSLYEKKYTTYPRVDTKYLPGDVYSKCLAILKGVKGYESLVHPLIGIVLPQKSRVFNDGNVTDHHAIIPTGHESGMLNETEQKVYDLVCRRFIAAFYPDCQFTTTTVCGKSGAIDFKVSGRAIQKDGWRTVYAKAVQSDDESQDDDISLPRFVIGESGPHTPGINKKMTTPPKQYTEASLLQSMETAGKLVDDETLREAMMENGIGRPSSRAGIIETLIKRGYVKREKKKLVSTELGRELIGVITSKMLKSPELTGAWEKKLRDIESGRYSIEPFMRELETQLRDMVSTVSAATRKR